MLGWVKIHYNDRWWWPRPPHNIGLFCMMVLKVYCVTQKECVWVRRGWDIIIALLKLRLRSQSVFLFLSSWFLFCFSFINCHFFPHLLTHFHFLFFYTWIFHCCLNTKLPKIFQNIFFDCKKIGNCYLILDIKTSPTVQFIANAAVFHFQPNINFKHLCEEKQFKLIGWWYLREICEMVFSAQYHWKQE